MSYDEMVNDLVRRYRDGDFPGWVMTDDAYAQMRRTLPDGRYEFIDTAPWGSDEAVIFHEVFSLDDYSEGELWFYGSAYYNDQDEFMGLGADTIAECVFEQTAHPQMCAWPDGTMREYLKIVKEG
ncbi:MAG: hypothetical protein IKH16_08005 [Selenomonadaceae bacterium]|nr:hypothetical protein [Selenomonadaceae bacterium]